MGKKRDNLLQFFSIVLLIIALNIIFSFFFFRLDLTGEKRYTLSKSTKSLLKNLDDVVYVKVYLDGSLPPDFAELSLKTREFLDEWRVYSPNIQYEFIDPSKGKTPQELNAIYSELYQKGLNPQPVQDVTAEGVNTRYIVPGALLSYRQQEIPVSLLDSDHGLLTHRSDIINYSIEKLEYNIGNAVRRLTHQQKARVAFLKGHGELPNMKVFDAALGIVDFYAVDSVVLDNKITRLFDVKITDSTTGDFSIEGIKYDLLVVAKPVLPFSDYEKFMLDQFVMRGGRILWYVDPVLAEMDSLMRYPEVPVLALDLNLEDLFFRYGVRMNTNLLQDFNALPIPVRSGEMAGQPQYKLIPWYYFPVITPNSDHPIVRNLNVLKTEFVSSIDTVGTRRGLKKTVLLTTSSTTKEVRTPAIISLEILKKRANVLEFNQHYVPIAVLVEGEFSSLFSGYENIDQKAFGFSDHSKPTKMIFVSDGDMIKNQLNEKNYPLPLGYDRYTDKAYGNRNFLLNAVNYLCDDEDILQVRSKDFKMRLLDSNRILKEKTFWQVLNVGLPLLLVLVLGLTLFFLRKAKYARRKQ
ncbi:MAG: gliding motility-associated ABC transporter substrate-binding protein GldG [Bacteroidales bacterium]|nr:gliding motility-associated ABC transporter substrate-binding protein GldG [Bacteroidales bacterium]